jgi:hypothetical protein
MLQDRLADAASCLRRLPLPKHGKPNGFGESWPDVVYDWLAYGWTPPRLGRIIPSPSEISQMDEMLVLLHLLSRDQRVVVWARANHWTWRRIEALDELENHGKGRTERTLRGIMHDGHHRILAHLNGTPGRMRLKPEQLR